jgi:hypothetical protein
MRTTMTTRDDVWAWRWTLAGAAFLLGGVVRGDTIALLLAFIILAPVAEVQDGVREGES